MVTCNLCGTFIHTRWDCTDKLWYKVTGVDGDVRNLCIECFTEIADSNEIPVCIKCVESNFYIFDLKYRIGRHFNKVLSRILKIIF